MHLRGFMHVNDEARLDKNSDSDMPWKLFLLETLYDCMIVSKCILWKNLF